MKGMIAKDLRILSEGKTLASLGVICGIVCLFTMKDPGFLIGYMTLIAASMGCMSCAYDEMNNGMAYLMTMPCSRLSYVLEKYIFAVCTGLAGLSVSLIIACIYNLIFDKGIVIETFGNAFVFLILIFIIPAVMIPVVLLFGHARSRIIIYVLIGIMFAMAGLMSLTNLVAFSVISGGVTVTVWDYQATLFKSGLMVTGVVSSVLLFAVSMIISIIIMKKKEF